MKNQVLLFTFFQSDVREANSRQRSRRKGLGVFVPLWSIFAVAALLRCGLRVSVVYPSTFRSYTRS